MEDAFEKLKQGKQNSVDNLIKWMKDSKLIDESKAAEEKARKLFNDVKDVTDVELDKFKKAVAQVAAEQQKSVAEFTKRLSEEGPKLLNAVVTGASTAVTVGVNSAVTAGVSAFKDALSKK